MPFTLDSIADLPAVITRREAANAVAAAAFPGVMRIAYGPGEAETFDLYLARDASRPAPVQIFVHGGFWSTMRAAQFAFVAPGFVPFGAALAVIDYPLIPDARMADIVASCKRAVAFIAGHAAEYGLDPARIYVSGNSAGGHLVAELMDSNRLIKGGTAISGLYDLAPVAASFRQEVLGFTDEEVARFSPLRRPPAIAAPLIVAVGGDETGEFLRQSAGFAAHASAGGAPVEHIVVPATNHITVVLDAFANPDAPLNSAVRRQMGARPSLGGLSAHYEPRPHEAVG